MAERGARRGSKTSDKQIAFAVRDGKQVSFHHGIEGIHTIRGYVFGADDYHWAVVTEELGIWLVHKSCPIVHLDSGSSLDAEPNREEIEKMVAPFRNYVLAEDFGQKNQGE